MNDTLTTVIEQRENELKKLRELNEQRQALDAQIATIVGGEEPQPTANKQPLVEVLEKVMKKTGEPVTVKDLAESVLNTGFRTNAKNFNAVVYQTIKEDPRFKKARGKRGGRKTAWRLNSHLVKA